jgi:hypothetical protein
MGGGLTAAAVTKSFNDALVELPTGFHTVGDSWDRTQETEGVMGRTAMVKMTFALKSITADDVAIDGKGTLDMSAPIENDAAPDDPGDMQAAMMREMLKSLKIVDSAFSSTVRVGRVDGFVVSRVTDVNTKFEMDGPMGGKLVVKAKNTSELSRITSD